MASSGPSLVPSGVSVFYPTPEVAAENLQNATLFTRIHVRATPDTVTNALARSPQLKNTFLLGHYNDILVFDRVKEEHIAHVRAVLQLLMDQDLRADIDYCAFDKPSWAEAGFYIDPVGGPGKLAFMIRLREAVVRGA